MWTNRIVLTSIKLSFLWDIKNTSILLRLKAALEIHLVSTTAPMRTLATYNFLRTDISLIHKTKNLSS